VALGVDRVLCGHACVQAGVKLACVGVGACHYMSWAVKFAEEDMLLRVEGLCAVSRGSAAAAAHARSLPPPPPPLLAAASAAAAHDRDVSHSAKPPIAALFGTNCRF
jgi:hypothetical protein